MTEASWRAHDRGSIRPCLRGAAGATLFTFKQFSVSYLELLKRSPRRERLLALAILTMSAGVNGLPFADDLDDLTDTFLQNLGIATSSKQARRAMLSKVLGQGAAEFLENGASVFLPIDVQGRLGMPDLIPGTGIGLKSNIDKASQALQALGPAGSLAQSAGTAVTSTLSGNIGAELNAFAPTAVQNAMKAMQMGEMGMYRDQAGRRVVDTTASDALWKGIGFQPEDVTGEQKKVSLVEERINLAKQVEGEIVGKWAQGIFEGDREKVEEAHDQLAAWNRDNPEDRIRIQPAAVARRVKEMRMSRVQRIEKLAPRSMRGEVRQELT